MSRRLYRAVMTLWTLAFWAGYFVFWLWMVHHSTPLSFKIFQIVILVTVKLCVDDLIERARDRGRAVEREALFRLRFRPAPTEPITRETTQHVDRTHTGAG